MNTENQKQPEPIDYETYVMQLAAISTASLQNTENSRKSRLPRSNTYWTAAYSDVCDAVDREIRWRNACEKARAILDRYLAGLINAPIPILDAFEELHDWRFPDTCPYCNGSGVVDSGGTTPWGTGIDMPCGCDTTKPLDR